MNKEEKLFNERFLYLIEFNNKYKIGVSINPEKRLKSFSLGSEAQIIWKKKFPHVFKIEKALHNEFSNKKFSNEWFSLNNEDIEYIKMFDIDEYLQFF
jgi:predicted GIY-YIG superfamily endonuclease